MLSDLKARNFEPPVSLVEIVFPDHCNHLGTLFGGQALAWMDKAAFLTATRYARCTTVTARTGTIDFAVPVRLGEIVEVAATIIKVGVTSMTLDVTVRCEGQPGGEQVVATSGTFVMIAVDESGRPTPIRHCSQRSPTSGA